MAAKKPAATVDEVGGETVEVSSAGLAKFNDKKMLQRMADIYRNEPKVTISISPLYVNEFSRNQPVSLNGIMLRIPTDGRNYEVPESFAMEIKARIAAADEKFKRLNKMADVQHNHERTPGELKLFR